MQPYNIINTNDTDTYLDRFAEGDKQLKALLKAALGKALLKVDSAIKTLDAIPQDAPQWLRDKWASQPAWHKFDPSDNEELESNVGKITHWLKTSIANNEPWLTMSVVNGIPKKLRAVGTMGHILSLTDKTTIAASSRLCCAVFNEKADNPLTKDAYMKLSHGYYVVHLKTPQDLKDESEGLGHCVGSGDHDQKLLSGESLFYSIRDHTGKRHVTIEVDSKTGIVIEAQGKQVAVPQPKYVQYLVEFLTNANFTLNEIPHATGILQQDGKFYSLYELPSGIVHKGDLDFSRVKNARIPADLKVGGNLILNGNEADKCPTSVEIGRDKILLWRNDNQQHHREDAPALIKIDQRTGITLKEIGYKDGINHGADRSYDRATGKLSEETIWDSGVRQSYTAIDVKTGKVTEHHDFTKLSSNNSATTPVAP